MDEKISQLDPVVVPALADEYAIAQAGSSFKITNTQIKALILSGGVNGTITHVVDLNKSGNMLQKKTRSITYTNGLVTAIGAESAWIDVGEFGTGYY